MSLPSQYHHAHANHADVIVRKTTLQLNVSASLVTDAGGNLYVRDRPFPSTDFVCGTTTFLWSNELWALISEFVRNVAEPDPMVPLRTLISVSRAALTSGFTTVNTSCLSCKDAEPFSPQKLAFFPSRS